MRRLALIGIVVCSLLFLGCRNSRIANVTGDDFLLAVWNGDILTVKTALERKIDVNTRDKYQATALIYAAQRGYLDILTLLLDYHADVNAKDVAGITALMEASRNGHLALVEQLLAAHADISVYDLNHNSALLFASAAPIKADETVATLLKSGADLNAQNLAGISPLIGAARSGKTGVVRMLLLQGADWNATTKDGKTALMLATENGHTQAVELLRLFGAESEIAPALWDWKNISLPTPEHLNTTPSPTSP